MDHNNGALRFDDWGQRWSDEWMKNGEEKGRQCGLHDDGQNVIRVDGR